MVLRRQISVLLGATDPTAPHNPAVPLRVGVVRVQVEARDRAGVADTVVHRAEVRVLRAADRAIPARGRATDHLQARRAVRHPAPTL